MASLAAQRSNMKEEARIKFKRDLQSCLQNSGKLRKPYLFSDAIYRQCISMIGVITLFLIIKLRNRNWGTDFFGKTKDFL